MLGKNLKIEDIEDINQAFSAEKAKAEEPMPGELVKSDDEIKFIQKINDYLSEEIENSGTKKDYEISQKQIHFLPQDLFQKNFPETEIGRKTAIQPPFFDQTYINKTLCQDDLMKYYLMMHESVHILSIKKYYVDEDSIMPYRSGYGIIHPEETETDPHEHFRGLNEALVEKIVIDIFTKHKQEICKEFNISDFYYDYLMPRTRYNYYIDILDFIAAKIAEKNSDAKENVWRRFKKGIFTGEMMHLRDIEKTFGKGSLRILAALESAVKPNFSYEESAEKIMRYFQTESETEKNEIAKEILNEEEITKYQTRKKQI